MISNPLPVNAAGGWARDDSTVSIVDPRTTITPSGSRSVTSPLGSAAIGGGATSSAALERQAAVATQAMVAAQAASTQVVEIRFPRRDGSFIPATVADSRLAQELTNLLRDEYERRGS